MNLDLLGERSARPLAVLRRGSATRRIRAWLAGLALALFLIGISLAPLTTPAFTRLLSRRTSQAQEAGLSPLRMAEVAEQVRRYVVDDDGRNLPAAVDGRPAFDDAAVSHLLDVRHVLEVVHILSGVLALVLVLGLVFEVARKRTMLIAEALAAGAVWSVALVAGCIVVALLDFDWFFSAFHRLFFDSGTWTFPGDSLLILTFPEPFWVTAGAVWGGLILAGAGVFAVAAQALWRGNSKALR